MNLTLDSRSVIGFNLSFFESEVDLISDYFNTINNWVETCQIKMPEISVFAMNEIGKAHEVIQSGKSIGKIVIDTNK